MTQYDRRALPLLPARYEGDENDIAVIVGIINDRKWIILSFFVAALVFALSYVVKVKPQFTATAEIMMSSTQNIAPYGHIQSRANDSALDIADLRSRVEIFQSPAMIRRLIAETKLFQNPEIGGSNQIQSFDDVSAKGRTIMVAQTQKRLGVRPVLGTSLIDVSYRSGDPLFAAYVANTLVKIYMAQETEAKGDQSRRVSDWLADRLESLRTDVKNAETALDEARQKGLLPDAEGQDARLQQMNLLGARLAVVEGEYAEATATLENLEKLSKDKEPLDVIDRFSEDPILLSLKTQANALDRERAALSQKYGPNHPSMRAIQKQIAAVHANFDDEIDLTKAKITSDQAIAKATLDELQDKIAAYRADYQSDAPARLSIRDLESEAVTARTLFNDFMAAYRESLQSIDFQQSNVTIISAATPPIAAAFPNKPLIVGLCAMTGLFIGIFMALILEKLQNVFQSVAQIERMTNIPVYGVLTRAKKMKSKTPSDYITGRGAVGLAELVRSLFMAFKLRDARKTGHGRVLTVTSTVSNEGKTTTSIWLATIAAQNGDKVLVIDADMRRPSLHKSYNVGDAKGLSDYLSDRLPLDDVIYRNHPSGVHIMTSKAIPTHALTLLTGERMESMVRRLRDMYDLIIIDAPAALVFSDARVVATLSDKTFYIVEWKKTRRDVFMAAIKQFTDMGYKDLAIVLNKADIDHYTSSKKGDLAYLQQMQQSYQS